MTSLPLGRRLLAEFVGTAPRTGCSAAAPRRPARHRGGRLHTLAQITGGIAGAVLANLMFDLTAVKISGTDRVTDGHLVGEIVAPPASSR